MMRLIVFLTLLAGFVGIFSLLGYKSLPVSHHPFDYEKTKKEWLDYKKIVSNPVKSKPKKIVVKKSVPVVVLNTPQLKNGHKVFTQKGKCITCHGKYGEGRRSQKAPRIGGQYAWYNADALIKMKNKQRRNKVMEPFLKRLSSKDLNDVAAYLEKLPWKYSP